MSDSRLDPVSRLTPRERECLRLVARHLQSKQIAQQLGISPYTVDKHIGEAMEKLEVRSRREAAILLTEQGVDGPPNGSGGEPFGLPEQAAARSSAPHNGSSDDEQQQSRHPAGLQPSRGGGSLQPGLAAHEPFGADADVFLGGARAPAHEPRGQQRDRHLGPGSGFGHTQARAMEAAGDGPSGDPLSRLDGHGQGLPAFGARRTFHDLNSAQRLTLVFLLAVVSVLSFGGLLAGLQALRALVS